MLQRSGVVLWMLAVSAGVASGQPSDEEFAALEARADAEGWTFTIRRDPVTEWPIEKLCGLVEPPNWRDGARFVEFPEKVDLPAAFDWREETGCPPIRDQGGCGSCWAFGTVGPLECNILIKDGVVVDLSEQWLVSCNQETTPPVFPSDDDTPSWGCNGGWFAHDYHEGTKTDAYGGFGAVLEEDFPYDADDRVPCAGPYPHAYKIDSWAFIGPAMGVADVNAIKQAILAYGPVSTGMTAGSAFSFYDSGVFNADVTSPPNHTIVLVGWDDNQGTEGVWFLRNSWGPYWGEQGYMRIEYGCSNVGHGACYVDYPGQCAGTSPVITRQPVGGAFVQGWMHALTVEAEGVGLLHYQWELDGEPVGYDSPVYAILDVSAADEGTYVCRVSDVCGTAVSNPAELTLDLEHTLPVSLAGVAGVLLGLVVSGIWLAGRQLPPSRR